MIYEAGLNATFHFIEAWLLFFFFLVALSVIWTVWYKVKGYNTLFPAEYVIHERQYLLNKQLTLVTFCFLTLCPFSSPNQTTSVLFPNQRMMWFSLQSGVYVRNVTSIFDVPKKQKNHKWTGWKCVGLQSAIVLFAKCKKNVNLWTYRTWISTHRFCIMIEIIIAQIKMAGLYYEYLFSHNKSFFSDVVHLLLSQWGLYFFYRVKAKLICGIKTTGVSNNWGFNHNIRSQIQFKELSAL